MPEVSLNLAQAPPEGAVFVNMMVIDSGHDFAPTHPEAPIPTSPAVKAPVDALRRVAFLLRVCFWVSAFGTLLALPPIG